MSKNRVVYFDIVKAVLIFFVVLGHVIENYTKNPVTKAIYLFIYAFHMPLFVFISGVFAKYNKKTCFNYLFYYLIFDIISILLKIFVFQPTTTFSTSKILNFIFVPQWTLWYIFALPIWVFSLKFIKNVTMRKVAIALVVALIVGFIPVFNSVLSISRIFYFYPFFLLGNICGGKNINKFLSYIKTNKNIRMKILASIFLIVLFFLFLQFQNSISKSIFYGSSPYNNIGDLFIRILNYLIGLSTSIAVLIIIPFPSNDKNILTKFISSIGTRTLSIYLFHSIAISFFEKYVPLKLDNLWYFLLFSISFSILIILLTAPLNFIIKRLKILR